MLEIQGSQSSRSVWWEIVCCNGSPTRDLFDVRMLLGSEGISREILVGFLTYTLSHPRPINEVMSPNWQPL